ncbi:MAG TPA: His/Gly/Thr/Pro-type tRNA ligase C-terminal domain-containing protein, partial [Thermoanaerobaculia bacterium]
VLPGAFRSRVLPEMPALVATVGDVPLEEALALAQELRRRGIAALAELGRRSLGNSLKRAGRLGARRVLILGEDEVAAGEVTVKDLATGEQRRLPRSEAVAALSSAVSEEPQG